MTCHVNIEGVGSNRVIYSGRILNLKEDKNLIKLKLLERMIF